MSNHALRAKIMANKKQAVGIKNLMFYIHCPQEKAFLRTATQKPKDINYFLQLWRLAKTLKKPDKKAMTNILGTEIDLTNIIWAYRLKKFYAIYGDATFGYLIPIHYKLSSEVFNRIAAEKNPDELPNILLSTPYAGVFNNFTNPEKKLNAVLHTKYKTADKTSHIALTCAQL